MSQTATLSTLDHGWNGYDAPAPTRLAIDTADKIVNAFAAIRPARVTASAVGGVGVTFRHEGRKAYIEVYNDGHVHALFSDGEGEPLTFPVTSDQYEGLAHAVSAYLQLPPARPDLSATRRTVAAELSLPLKHVSVLWESVPANGLTVYVRTATGWRRHG